MPNQNLQGSLHPFHGSNARLKPAKDLSPCNHPGRGFRQPCGDSSCQVDFRIASHALKGRLGMVDEILPDQEVRLTFEKRRGGAVVYSNPRQLLRSSGPGGYQGELRGSLY